MLYLRIVKDIPDVGRIVGAENPALSDGPYLTRTYVKTKKAYDNSSNQIFLTLIINPYSNLS